MSATRDWTRPRVLLVDDDDGHRSTLEAILDAHYEVCSFAEPLAALAAVEDGLIFDLALVDQRMPLMAGTELLARLRARDPRPRRLVLSGAADADDLRAAINDGGVYRFVLKPYDPEQLLAVMKEAFDRYSLEYDRDRLLSKLREANERLTELAQTLEAKVRERTQALDAANRELSTLARTDPLTGLANRRQLEEHLDRDIQRARRFHHPLSLMMIDLDHFKAVNDQRGHLVGDEVLKAVATRIRDNVRNVDLVARWGGDEFVVVAPETGVADAVISAERIRAEVASNASRWGVTLSIGVAGWAEGKPAQELINDADALLYRAKSGGRDRVAAQAEI